MRKQQPMKVIPVAGEEKSIPCIGWLYRKKKTAVFQTQKED